MHMQSSGSASLQIGCACLGPKTKRALNYKDLLHHSQVVMAYLYLTGVVHVVASRYCSPGNSKHDCCGLLRRLVSSLLNSRTVELFNATVIKPLGRIIRLLPGS